MTAVPEVYTAICAVMSDIGQTGIAKGRKNQQQGYSFRGIDDVYNELNSLLSRHQLVMVPRILTREVTERQTQKGGALFYVTVEAEFDLISAKDGSKHTVRTLGEAMDSADKATNKAMSAAYKYAAMMVFCIPTEGDNDADSVTHEIAPKRTSSAALKREDIWPAMEQEISECGSVAKLMMLRSIWAKKAGVDKWPPAWCDAAAETFDKAEAELNKMAEREADDFPGDTPLKGNAYADNYQAG